MAPSTEPASEEANGQVIGECLVSADVPPGHEQSQTRLRFRLGTTQHRKSYRARQSLKLPEPTPKVAALNARDGG